MAGFASSYLLFSTLLLLLLKCEVHGAFTQTWRSSTSYHNHNHNTVCDPFKQAKHQSPVARHRFSDNNIVKHKTNSRQQTSALCATSGANGVSKSAVTARTRKCNHVLAILTMPYTSMDRIANEAVLHEALQHTDNKLSIVLRCEGGKAPSLASLRRYVGEVYSQLWDFSMATENAIQFNDVVVYPQNLPNAAAEQWINHLPDLDAICSHDSICGWISEGAQGRGTQFQYLEGGGVGGLETHVAAVNADRLGRNLPQVKALHVANWPIGASSSQLTKEHVLFVDDDIPYADSSDECYVSGEAEGKTNGDNDGCLLGGARIPDNCLFNCVAVGGTFDGMHYGHRKLLTLAVSSVLPVTGKLTVGVTVDDMLKTKQFAEYIPPLKERMKGVKDFLHRLAPGMKNRILLRAISDPYGPPGKSGEGEKYDALVLSHETLENGVKLNQHREETLGYEPLTLLCTRRTEAYGMSSTALRRLKSMSKVENALDRV